MHKKSSHTNNMHTNNSHKRPSHKQYENKYFAAINKHKAKIYELQVYPNYYKKQCGNRINFNYKENLKSDFSKNKKNI